MPTGGKCFPAAEAIIRKSGRCVNAPTFRDHVSQFAPPVRSAAFSILPPTFSTSWPKPLVVAHEVVERAKAAVARKAKPRTKKRLAAEDWVQITFGRKIGFIVTTLFARSGPIRNYPPIPLIIKEYHKLNISIPPLESLPIAMPRGIPQ